MVQKVFTICARASQAQWNVTDGRSASRSCSTGIVGFILNIAAVCIFVDGGMGGRPGHWAKERISVSSVMKWSLDTGYETVYSRQRRERRSFIMYVSSHSVSGLEWFVLGDVLVECLGADRR